MADLKTHCRCGVELHVRHGGVIHCTHCDGGCSNPSMCGFCRQLALTCSDCGTLHKDVRARVKCETSHS